MAGMSPVASVVAQPSKSLMEVASTLNLSKWEFFYRIFIHNAPPVFLLVFPKSSAVCMK